MSDVPTIQERVSRATRSSNLKHKENACDVDKVGALGMAGLDNGVASAVFRLKYGNDAKSYAAARDAVDRESKALGRRHGWEGSGAQFKAMNKAALDFWLNDRCLACAGRGHLKELGAPFLQAAPCPACNGSGRMLPPAMPDKSWEERFAMLLAKLEELERRAGSDVMARLASEMSEFR